MEDTQLVHIALERGFLTQEQHERLLGEQAQMADRGLKFSIWGMACDQGLISEANERVLLEEVRKETRQPRVIAGYRIMHRLGRGGMGQVYLGEGPQGAKVAIKLLNEDRATNVEALQRFRRESQAILALHHPNIVRGLAAGTDNGSSYLVMNHIEGPSLKDRIDRNQLLTSNEALVLLVQAATGLRHAWRAGILHRDVKPGNLLLAPKREGMPEPFCVKVCDFGLARSFLEPKAPEVEDDIASRPGLVMGTPLYMSPEQAAGSDDLEQRTDIFGLGAALFHAVSGRSPQSEPNTNTMLWRRIHEDIDLEPLIGLGLSEGFLKILQGMLERKRSRRIQDWDWVLQGCRQLEPAIVDPLLASQPAYLSKPNATSNVDQQRRCAELVSSRIEDLTQGIDHALQVIQRGSHDAESVLAISTIRRQVQQVHSMAENLEVLSQDRPLRRDPINLRRLAHDVMVKLEELTNRLQISIEIEGDGSVVGDPRLSYIALLNMVRNGVVACRGAGKIRIQLRDGLLVVADQGHGIPERVLANLFDPIANDRVFGLGATVARICQRRQGGEVRLIRTSDEGTAFGLLWSSRTPRKTA